MEKLRKVFDGCRKHKIYINLNDSCLFSPSEEEVDPTIDYIGFIYSVSSKKEVFESLSDEGSSIISYRVTGLFNNGKKIRDLFCAMLITYNFRPFLNEKTYYNSDNEIYEYNVDIVITDEEFPNFVTKTVNESDEYFTEDDCEEEVENNCAEECEEEVENDCAEEVENDCAEEVENDCVEQVENDCEEQVENDCEEEVKDDDEKVKDEEVEDKEVDGEKVEDDGEKVEDSEKVEDDGKKVEDSEKVEDDGEKVEDSEKDGEKVEDIEKIEDNSEKEEDDGEKEEENKVEEDKIIEERKVKRVYKKVRVEELSKEEIEYAQLKKNDLLEICENMKITHWGERSVKFLNRGYLIKAIVSHKLLSTPEKKIKKKKC